MALYRIGTVARLCGVPIETLRNWERRYAVVVATRAEGGQRLYSREDVERLRAVRHWIDSGFSAREAHALLRERDQRRVSLVASVGDSVREQALHVRQAAIAARARAAETHARSAAIAKRLSQRSNPA